VPLQPIVPALSPSVSPRINPINPSNISLGASSKAGSFEGLLGKAVQNLASLQQGADTRAAQLATGQDVSLVDTVLAMERTSLSFSLAMQVRNKVVEAYQDVMRMQM
jgi:flagellar hook-basal body complex protein FliE